MVIVIDDGTHVIEVGKLRIGSRKVHMPGCRGLWTVPVVASTTLVVTLCPFLMPRRQ